MFSTGDTQLLLQFVGGPSQSPKLRYITLPVELVKCSQGNTFCQCYYHTAVNMVISALCKLKWTDHHYHVFPMREIMQHLLQPQSHMETPTDQTRCRRSSSAAPKHEICPHECGKSVFVWPQCFGTILIMQPVFNKTLHNQSMNVTSTSWCYAEVNITLLYVLEMELDQLTVPSLRTIKRKMEKLFLLYRSILDLWIQCSEESPCSSCSTFNINGCCKAKRPTPMIFHEGVPELDSATIKIPAWIALFYWL